MPAARRPARALYCSVGLMCLTALLLFTPVSCAMPSNVGPNPAVVAPPASTSVSANVFGSAREEALPPRMHSLAGRNQSIIPAPPPLPRDWAPPIQPMDASKELMPPSGVIALAVAAATLGTTIGFIVASHRSPPPRQGLYRSASLIDLDQSQ
jgi:hypothetical protein